MIRPLFWDPNIEINILAATVTQKLDTNNTHYDRAIVDWELYNHGPSVHLYGLNKTVLIGEMEVSPAQKKYNKGEFSRIPLLLEVERNYRGIGINEQKFSGNLETAFTEISVSAFRKLHPAESNLLKWLNQFGFSYSKFTNFFNTWFHKEVTIKSASQQFQRITDEEKRFSHPEINEDTQKAQIIGF